MASTYLTRTFTSSGNRKKWTMSYWLKRDILGSSNIMFQTYVSDYTWCRFDTNNKFQFQDGGGGNKVSTRTFKDTNAWYHFVVAIDTDNSTADDRYKIYVNGERITAFDTSSNPSSGYEGNWNKNVLMNIGRHSGGSDYFSGLMSHIHFCDGYEYQPSDFGSTDSTTGEWKINASPSVSYGTNGFFILKDGNSVTDQSGNSNNWTANGNLTNTEDCPSNVFSTLNPLFGAGGQFATMSNGNTTSYTSNLGVAGTSTLGASSGKYYTEFKHSACTSGGADEGAIGVCDTYFISSNSNLGGSSSPGYQEYSLGNWGLRNTSGRFFYSSGGAKYTADNQHAGWSLGDIIMLGLDCDNNRLYFGKNGQWSSSNTWSSSTPSQYITIDPTNFQGNYHFACGDSSGTNVSTWQCNFGNGYFGTTAVSSAGTNASGIGIFEYDVPTGYTALSTKGLNE